MGRSVGCHIGLDLEGASDLVLAIAPSADNSVRDEQLDVTLGGDDVEVREVQDDHGGRLHLLTAPGRGRLEIRYQASIAGRARPAPLTDLDVVRYRRPSRYCESDRLSAFARAEFAGLDGLPLLDAVSSWVGTRVVYIEGSSRPTDGAVTTLLSGQGVCRDFAHLVIAMLRACDMPARLVSVYAPGLYPMDFHAVAEAVVDGAWLVSDATCLAPRAEMVRIATGHDAAGTAFLSSSGEPATLTSLEVVAIAEPDLAVDDITEPVQLG